MTKDTESVEALQLCSLIKLKDGPGDVPESMDGCLIKGPLADCYLLSLLHSDPYTTHFLPNNGLPDISKRRQEGSLTRDLRGGCFFRLQVLSGSLHN